MGLKPSGKILVMTDIHLVEAGSDIIGIDPFTRFCEVLDHALDHHPDANRIIITGDLTHHGRAAQYQRLRDRLADISMPFTLMLGNHDDRDTFREVFGGSGYVHHVIETPDATLICLDTLDGPRSGLLCAERLDWLDAQLSTAKSPVIIFLHHPPFDTGFDGMDGINLQNADAFFEVIARHNTVAHLICGHVHRTISGHVRGVPYSIFKSPCHQMPMLLGEDGTSHSVDEPGAYGIILLHKTGIVAHTEDVGVSRRILTDPSSK